MSEGSELVTSSDQPVKIDRINGADVAASIARSGLGAIPVVGAAAAEVITALIPGQRLDRIQSFLEKLAERVKGIDQALVEHKIREPEGVDLLEDCLQGAARALSDGRLQHLANLYATGITSETADHETNKKMASLLSQLTDAEVIWLAELAQFRSINERPDRHEEILNPRVAYIGSPVEAVDAHAIQDAWKNRLIQLGLAEQKLKKPPRGESAEFDSFTGDWKRQSPKATWLGRMLLGYIGIEEPLRGRSKGSAESRESLDEK